MGYWDNTGAEQTKYDELVNVGWVDGGKMLQASLQAFRDYQRYYNDGDMPGWSKGREDGTREITVRGAESWEVCRWVLTEKGKQELEDRATEAVLIEYARYMKDKRK